MVMDKSWISSDRLSNAYDEGVEAFLEFAQSNNPNSDSDHEKDSKSQRGPTIKSKANKGKTLVTYNKRGVPIGDGAKKLASFEGMVARSMVPITYDSWLEVGEETKETLWQHVLEHFVLDPKSRKHTLQSIGTKWKNFKHCLYKKFIKTQKDDPEADLLNPPTKYPFLKIEDWKLFVAQRISEKWEDKSKKAKNVRAHNKYNHHLSRKGYAGLIVEIMQETGKAEEEIDRALCWKRGRELKTGGFDPDVKKIVDRIDELHNSEDFREDSFGTHDVLTQALGTEEQRGRVRGMGKFVKQNQYFFLPKTIKQYLDNEKKKMDLRLHKVEDELGSLKKGINNVSERASCQMWGNEDFEDEVPEESLDNSCYLAVDVISNIVAKGNIVKYSVSAESIEVMMEVCVQGEALLPIPLEEEFIEKVKDAVGYRLSWPRHLVIRCSDLDKMVTKPMRKDTKPKLLNVYSRRSDKMVTKPMRKDVKPEIELESKKDAKKDEERKRNMKKRMEKEKETGKELESQKGKKRQRESDEENEYENGKETEARKIEVNEKETMQRRMGRGQRTTKIRIEKSVALKQKEKETGKELESQKGKKRQREPDEENECVKGKEMEARKIQVNEKETMQRKMTRGQRKTRIRIEKSVALKLTAMMVDGQVSKVDSIKVQCEDHLFGYESYTYLTWDDFEAVFTLDELTGAIITSYIMFLYEQIKNGPKRNRGICFMSPTATSQSKRKSKSKYIADSSRSVADRLSKKKDNDIILLPYNPGGHWVLAVLDMKTTTCYYLDSLRPSKVNLHLRQIIDAAMGLYAVQNGSNKKVKLNWVNARCPCQPGSSECGYYMLKFMKEVVGQGVDVLVSDNIGGGKNQYTDDDIDEIREEWSTYVANFIFR